MGLATSYAEELFERILGTEKDPKDCEHIEIARRERQTDSVSWAVPYRV
jgi:hypothetical protein